MKYLGSKNKLAKFIIPIITKNINKYNYYIEPFVGGANIIDKIPCNLKRIGYDKNFYLISLLKYLQTNKPLPDLKKLNKKEYLSVKENKNNYESWYTAFIGFNSVGGGFFNGYRSDKEGKRNYWEEHIKNLEKQRVDLKDINFICSDYKDIVFPKEPCLIYCDPPYQGNKRYKHSIDYDEFWQWCRDLSNKGHEIYISESIAPSDFKCIWEKESIFNIINERKNVTERLFTY